MLNIVNCIINSKSDYLTRLIRRICVKKTTFTDKFSKCNGMAENMLECRYTYPVRRDECHVIKWCKRFKQIKIDSNSIKESMLKGLLLIAEESGSVVVAEGIESKGEAMVLSRNNVDLAQGFFYGRPASVEQMSMPS
jgi:hypothetical protein